MGSTSARWFEGAAEGLLLTALVLAPWPYGCAPDWARYTLCALVAAALSLFAVGRTLGGEALPKIVAPLAGLVAVGGLQLAINTTAAPLFTAEATLVLGALSGGAIVWSARAASRGASLRLAAAVLAVCTAQAVFGAVQW